MQALYGEYGGVVRGGQSPNLGHPSRMNEMNGLDLQRRLPPFSINIELPETTTLLCRRQSLHQLEQSLQIRRSGFVRSCSGVRSVTSQAQGQAAGKDEAIQNKLVRLFCM